MEKRVLGKTGLEVSVLGFGGAEIGLEAATQQTVRELLAKALDAGLNAIDTAECYGKSEELIGEAVSKRRDSFYLFTKCGHTDNYLQGAWSKKELGESIDRSLKRLKTDYVDLLQLHSCSEKTLARGEVVEALQKAQKEGKTRFIGYSGDSLDAQYALNMDVFDTLQTSVNIFDQECLDLTLPLAKAKNMGVIAKRPIGNAVWRHKEKPANSYVHEYWERMKALSYDFSRASSDQIAEIAMRFTLAAEGVTTMIVGTKRPERWVDNAKLVAKGSLEAEQVAAIRKHWQEKAKADWVGQV
jgi:aryl-alcohol dehydrogenase-like predicted oxidoreductase